MFSHMILPHSKLLLLTNHFQLLWTTGCYNFSLIFGHTFDFNLNITKPNQNKLISGSQLYQVQNVYKFSLKLTYIFMIIFLISGAREQAALDRRVHMHAGCENANELWAIMSICCGLMNYELQWIYMMLMMRKFTRCAIIEWSRMQPQYLVIASSNPIEISYAPHKIFSRME